MVESIKMSEDQEGLLVAVAAAAGAIATYIGQSSLSNELKIPIVTILGVFSIGALAYWKARVNVKIEKKISGA